MWNAPLTNGIALSVATGCALFLFGLAVGLVIVGVCWAFIAASGDRQAHPSQESYATISDDEIEIVIELVRDAIAGSGWALCGDCYTRNLLQQLPLPMKERTPAVGDCKALLSSGQEDLAMHSAPRCTWPTSWVRIETVESIDNTRERPGRSKSTQWVDLALPLAHTMPESGKNRPEQHLCEGQVYPLGRLAPRYRIANERNAFV